MVRRKAKLVKLQDPEWWRMMPRPGLQICFRPRVSSTDLLIPKVDRFMLLFRGPLVRIGVHIQSFSKYRA